METPGAAPIRLRKVRSFVRRPGRATAAQRRAFAELLPRYGVAEPWRAPRPRAAVRPRRAARARHRLRRRRSARHERLNNPTVDYLGVEVHEPGIGHLLLLLEQAAVTNVRVIARDAADVVPELLPDAKLRRRRSVLPGSVAEEAPSQAAARAAAVRRGARARAEAGRPVARRDGLGRLRAPHSRSARREHAVRAASSSRVRRRAARRSSTDEVRAPRRAPRPRRRRSLLPNLGRLYAMTMRSRALGSTPLCGGQGVGESTAHHDPEQHESPAARRAW